ncbi:unnamed protein product [Leptosia nina]|uniref:Cytochrome P450 n=1 Tax=Leptosia nina TaxID=320188 RepID=A0AAV1JRX3_9NEOP
MFLVLLCVGITLWYVAFRYKRRRLYELADLVPGPETKIPLIGIIEESLKPVVLSMDFASSITNPIDVEFVTKKCLQKYDMLLKIFRSFNGDSGIFAPVHIWTRRRKLTVAAYSPKVVNSYVDVIVQKTEELTERLRDNNCVGTGPFKIGSYIGEYSLEAIFEAALGVNNTRLSDSKRSAFIKATTHIFASVATRLFSVWLWPDFIYYLTPSGREFKRCMDLTTTFADEIIQNKRKELKISQEQIAEMYNDDGPKKVSCFLEHLLLLSSKDNITDLELKEEVLTFLFAGTDTSSVGICNTLKLLAKYPKVQEKLYQEIMEVLGDPSRTLVKEDLQNLKYLERVIKESLRLFPPVPIISREAEEEIQLHRFLASGTRVPAHAGIIILVWGIGRDPEQWGPDADCFDPDRFLPGRKTGLFVPFSTGPRNCLGYQFAFISMKLALTAILRRYKVTGEEESGPVPVIDCSFNVMMKAKDGYEICLEER